MAIEALIVASFFTVILAGAVAMHRAYATHLTIINEARLAAWKPALEGCGDTPALDSAADTVTSAAQSGETEPDVSTEGMEGWMLVATHEESRGTSVSVLGESKQVGARRTVACNEGKPPDFNIKSFLDRVGGVLLGD